MVLGPEGIYDQPVFRIAPQPRQEPGAHQRGFAAAGRPKHQQNAGAAELSQTLKRFLKLLNLCLTAEEDRRIRFLKSHHAGVQRAAVVPIKAVGRVKAGNLEPSPESLVGVLLVLGQVE